MKMKSKHELREYFKAKRKSIPYSRQEEAKTKAFNYLTKEAEPFTHILSYSSLINELDLSQLNELLCTQNKLVLPRVEKDELELYHVKHIDHLMPGKYKNLEPNPIECSRFMPKNIEFAIIPALCADATGNRIGFGLGYYDKLLEKMPQAYTICPIYHEQLSCTPLPKLEHDIIVKKVFSL